MELTSEFSVPLTPDATWNALLDFGRVARAMPGVHLDEVSGNEIQGSVTVRLGPMKIEYTGSAQVDASDPDKRQLIISASGDEKRGTGSASANIETRLRPDESGTSVEIRADVNITGRPAQMGVGLIQDVARRLTDEFAERLRSDLIDESSRPDTQVVKTVEGADLDLLRLASGPVARRFAIGATVVTVLWLLRRMLR